jgi:hypothetical protein
LGGEISSAARSDDEIPVISATLTNLPGLREMAHVLRWSGKERQRERRVKTGGTMVSDLIMYALLASIFIVTGLRMFVEKPNKLKEIPVARKRIKPEK